VSALTSGRRAGSTRSGVVDPLNIPQLTGAAALVEVPALRDAIERGLGTAFCRTLMAALEPHLARTKHGDMARWVELIRAVHLPERGSIALDQPAPGVDFKPDEASLAQLLSALEGLTPWRKGPFQLGSVTLDAEWDSSLKWQRFAPHVNLQAQRVLDVGAGNGYFMLRAVGAGAHFVLGLEPSWHYVAQWNLLRRLLGCELAALVPMRLEEFPVSAQPFDVVLSMGVLYHQRDPLSHLTSLRQALAPGGQLILESLVISEERSHCLVPSERYAAMRNVWFVPSVECLKVWLRRTGFVDVQLLDLSATTSLEQRSTPFMKAPSLRDFLDPLRPGLTVEGYPAPVRAVLSAR
jgi:tRNA (mo5U34)-methyltransferase